MITNNLLFLCLFSLGLITGFIGTGTGGSVLITIPTMIALGISPQLTISSARIASIGTMIGGLRQFHKNNKVDYKIAWLTGSLGIIGSIIGAYGVIKLPEIFLKNMLAFLVLTFSFLSFYKKKHINTFESVSYTKKIIGYFLFLFIGMLGGVFGGQSIIATYILVNFFNKDILEAIGTRKVSGLAISLAAIFIYGILGSINWLLSLSLMSGTLLGSTLGSIYILKKKNDWINKIFCISAILMAFKMIFIE